MSITPGPWEANKEGQLIGADNPYGCGYMMIAKVRGWGHLTGKSACAMPQREAVEIHNANMNLIASAPELLEALKWTERALDKEHPAAIKARQIIARAEGGSC